MQRQLVVLSVTMVAKRFIPLHHLAPLQQIQIGLLLPLSMLLLQVVAVDIVMTQVVVEVPVVIELAPLRSEHIQFLHQFKLVLVEHHHIP
jgi:hypothetical protein